MGNLSAWVVILLTSAYLGGFVVAVQVDSPRWRWFAFFGLPWKLYVYPLMVALAALGFAVWVAWWSTFGSPGGPFAGRMINPGPLLAVAALVFTGAVALTVLLYGKSPPQRVTFSVSEGRRRSPPGVLLVVSGRNEEASVTKLRVTIILLTAGGEEVVRYSAGGGDDLAPKQEFSTGVDIVRAEADAAETIRLEWTTERGPQRPQEVPFPPLRPPPGS